MVKRSGGPPGSKVHVSLRAAAAACGVSSPSSIIKYDKALEEHRTPHKTGRPLARGSEIEKIIISLINDNFERLHSLYVDEVTDLLCIYS
jgi:hypothetical protein